MSSKKTSSWLLALKKWNEGNKTWCIPKRGSPQYEEVIALKNGFKNPSKPKKVLKIVDEKKATKVLKASPTTTASTKTKNIVNEWNDDTLPIILLQNDKKTYDAIEKLILTKLKQKKLLFINLLLAFTKEYNDKVFEKYDKNVLFNGIENIVDYILQYVDDVPDNFIKNPLRNGEYDKIPKGSMKKRNIEKMLKE